MSTARRFVLSQTGLKPPAARELPRWLRFESRCETDREQSPTASRQETALFHQSQLQCIRVGFTLSASTPTRSSCLALGHGVHKYSPQVGLVDILFVHHFASRSSPGAYTHHPYLRTCLIATLLLYHHSSSCSNTALQPCTNLLARCIRGSGLCTTPTTTYFADFDAGSRARPCTGRRTPKIAPHLGSSSIPTGRSSTRGPQQLALRLTPRSRALV